MMILGVDPGRDKIGWALANCDGDLFASGICPVSEQEHFLVALRAGCWEQGLLQWMMEKPKFPAPRPEKLSFIAIGNGTGSQEVAKLFEHLGVQVVTVDEKETTLEARWLYWDFHALSWWQRYLPRVMWFPPRPLDDLAALAIVRRSLLLNK